MGSESSKTEKPQRQQPAAQATSRREYIPQCLPQRPEHSNTSPAPQLPAQSLERNRAPYNYTNRDLENNIRQSNPQRLYPDLDNANRNAPQQTPETTAPGVQNIRHNDNSTSGLNSTSEEGYVILNHYQQRAHLKPSAPPAADVMGLQETSPSYVAPKPPQPRLGPSNPGPSSAPHSVPASKAPRSRSVSRCRFLDPRFNCPTCTDRLGLTIYNCSRGHGSCKECKEGGKVCGSDQGRCGAPITGMRNIALEAYVAEIGRSQLAQCENTNCTLKFNIHDMEKHLSVCPFGEMQCPMGTFFGRCTYRCKVDDLASHFDSYHKDQRDADVDKEMFLFNISCDTQKLYFLKNGPYNFLVHIKTSKKERMVYMAVQLLGSTVSSAKWTYEIHIYNKRQPRRKFLYVDTCQSIGSPLNDIFAKSKCATIPIAYAKSFVNDITETLTYKFFIKKTDTQTTNKRADNPRWRNNEWKRKNLKN